MSIFKPKFFSNADIVRTIDPIRLLQLLQPYAGYFSKRGLPLPSPFAASFDIDRLVEILSAPDEEAPQDLLNAIGYIDEMSTPSGMDLLLNAATLAGMLFDATVNCTPADIAVQVWLYDQKIVEREHAWYTWRSPRRMECFQPIIGNYKELVELTPSRIELVTINLGDYFGGSNRSTFCKLHVRESDELIEVSIQRGDPFQRKPKIEENQVRNIHYRPAGKDVVVLRKADHVLQCNSSMKRAIRIYQRVFGTLLFDDSNYFADENVYTLAPFEELGEEALSWADFDEIESVVLTKYRVSCGSKAFETLEAENIVDFLRDNGRSFKFPGRLVDVTFQIKFRGTKSWRTVKLYAGNAACYTRDSNAAAIERWLMLRRFIVRYRVTVGGEGNEQTLASA